MKGTEKKYQVFVSSTFEDLQEERQEVIHALLELDCIPSGMELFPAANEDQWTLIKEVIKDCDYYLVIIAGRYGSLDSKGMSYTEKEYRYAMELGKPIIAFLHKDPDTIPKKYTEKSEKGQKKLDEFRDLAKQKMVKYWTTPQDLGSVVSRGLIQLQKAHPGIGWIRGNAVSSKDAQIQILKLQQENEQLRKLNYEKKNIIKDTSEFSQGDDKVSIHYDFKSTDDNNTVHDWNHYESVTWNEIFYWILPLMVDDTKESLIKSTINEFLYEKCKDKYKKDHDIKNNPVHSFDIHEKDFQTIIIQARALGLIQKSDLGKQNKLTGRFWLLTEKGDELMNSLRAIKKKSRKKK
ncbi:MAG: DUF4062 domain-containing protein [Ignavibacteriae bacterium]|nr:DUF4062 domain-containing protein [Ignavibacteriota bacterium]